MAKKNSNVPSMSVEPTRPYVHTLTVGRVTKKGAEKGITGIKERSEEPAWFEVLVAPDSPAYATIAKAVAKQQTLKFEVSCNAV